MPEAAPQGDGGAVEGAIAGGMAALGVAGPAQAPRRLARYVSLLARWNRVYNLTAVREPGAMVQRHVLDALSLLAHLPHGRALDLGTGAGLPGLVLATVRPRMRWVLLDGNAKKTRFCLQAAAELGLDNVQVVQCRAEDYLPGPAFDVIVARGVGSLARLAALAAPLLAPGGRLILMKGAYPHAELEEYGPMRENARVIPVHVPGLPAQRHLVVMDKGEKEWTTAGA